MGPDLDVFQVWPYRTQIDNTQLGLLKLADHIAWHRPYVIWHHAIVAGINIGQQQLEIIHYTTTGVERKWINPKEQWGDFFRFDYPTEITNKPDVVLKRANSRIGERQYDLIDNNCEHFATLCKIGIEDSMQIIWLCQHLKETAQVFATNCSKAIFCIIGKLVANSMGKVALSETIERLLSGTNEIGFAIVGAIEFLHCISDIYKMSKETNVENKIYKAVVTQRVAECVAGASLCMFTSVVGEMVGSAVCPSLFGMAGGYLGRFVQVIGTSVGATLGTAAGAYIGKFAGSVVGGLVGLIIGKPLGSIFGHYLGKLLW